MKDLFLWAIGAGFVIILILEGPVYSSHDPSPSIVVPFPSHTITGEIIAKGTVKWEERLTPMQENRLEKDYLVLRVSEAFSEIFVVEFEPLFISADQFQLGETIQAHLAEDGSLISATHMY